MSIKFIKGFVAKPGTTGAIVPSSGSLAKEMLRYFPVDQKPVIVELGPGTGAITKQIVEKKHVNQDIYAFELNLDFEKHLRNKFPEVEFFFQSATTLPEILKNKGDKKVGLVVSSLPWANFNQDLQDNLLDVIRESMSENAVFSTYAYVHALKLKKAKNFAERLNHYFEEVHTSEVVWKNLPPAIIYHCFKKARGLHKE